MQSRGRCWASVGHRVPVKGDNVPEVGIQGSLMKAIPGLVDSSPDTDASFHRNQLRADTRTAGRVRDEFARWLGLELSVSDACRSDLVLAVYEALANAAEHAYSAASGLGAMHLTADYDADDDTLRVVVDDHGQWRGTDRTSSPHPGRGRGIPLIKVLADDTTINTTPDGTRVSMTWSQVHTDGA